MTAKPHPVAIGAFILGAILIALVTLLFLLGSGFGKRETVAMVFDGSVKGLNVGAPMTLRGVQVGQVTGIELVLDSSKANVIMMVEAELNAKNIRREGYPNANLIEELITRGLRAQLNTQSLLTGLLFIELDFHPNTPLMLADIQSQYVQLPTIPTNLQRIAQKLEDVDVSKLTRDLESISNGINSLVSSEDFQNLPANVNTTMVSMRELSARLQQQLDSSGPKLDTVLDKAAVTVSAAQRDLPKLVSLIEGNLKVLNSAIAAFEQGMGQVEGLASPDSPTLYQLNTALQEVTRASRSLQSLANTLETQPEALIHGKRGDEQ